LYSCNILGASPKAMAPDAVKRIETISSGVQACLRIMVLWQDFFFAGANDYLT
jgi:hypothetical protein